jgi:quercetin dioxygenase-like cupin family protein
MKTASFLQNVEYNENKPALSVLLKTDFSKEIRIVFKANQVMTAHKAPKPIVVAIIEGQIDFEVENTTYQLKRGDVIAVTANVIHSLKANADSVVRLSLSKNDALSK